ncbi:hypothetical protein [Microbacterium kunmingense]|uniref:hypothetical protein n=1 Tax=Microbacterium kunmingense TaxID=2915939 RepID=UPI003D737E56
MTPETTLDELRRLRERAWGPAADLTDDPAALERWQALEAAARAEILRTDAPARPDDEAEAFGISPSSSRAATRDTAHIDSARTATAHTATARTATATARTDPAHTDPAASAPGAPSPADADAAGDAGDAASGSPPADERPPLRAWFPRRRVPWAASIIAAAAIGAVIAVAGATTVERTGGGQQVGTLATDPDFAPPDFLGIPAESLRGFDEFYGLSVFSSREEWIGGGTDECLLVVGDGGETQRQVFLGCGVGAFAASVQFRVQPGMPSELLERFPEGTPLQFVRQGSDVRVLAGDTP